MTDREDTSSKMLIRAAQIGQDNGLRFVYAGNRSGRVGQLEHTRCPTCGTVVIERAGYQIRLYRLGTEGRCISCGTVVAGRWDLMFGGQRASVASLPVASDLHGI